MRYDAVIIGAGVAGLTAGLILSREGKKVLILEKQSQAGGFAAGFHRKGFTFEAALHCVDSLGKDGDIGKFLADSGLDAKLEFLETGDFSRIVYPEHDLIADADPGHLIAYLKHAFPREAGNLTRFFRNLDTFYGQFDAYCASSLPAWLDAALTRLRYPVLADLSRITTQQLLERSIKDPRLCAILSDIWRFAGLPPARLSALYFLLLFRGYYYMPTAYIKGGFNRLISVIIKEIQRNGSEVRFKQEAVGIITKKGRATAVATADGEIIEAGVVISNANALDTLCVFPDDEKVKNAYRLRLSPLEKSVSGFQVYLGLDVPAGTLGMSHRLISVNTSYDHKDDFASILSGDYALRSFQLTDHASLDPSLVPQGKGSLVIMCLDAYANWQGLGKDAYQAKKQAVARQLIGRAQQFLPRLPEHIEVMEIATPRTMERFVGSPEGAMYGFAQTPQQAGSNRLGQKTAVRGLFLAGAWTRPGAGVHGCFVSGMDAAELALGFLG